MSSASVPALFFVATEASARAATPTAMLAQVPDGVENGRPIFADEAGDVQCFFRNDCGWILFQNFKDIAVAYGSAALPPIEGWELVVQAAGGDTIAGEVKALRYNFSELEEEYGRPGEEAAAPAEVEESQPPPAPTTPPRGARAAWVQHGGKGGKGAKGAKGDKGGKGDKDVKGDKDTGKREVPPPPPPRGAYVGPAPPAGPPPQSLRIAAAAKAAESGSTARSSATAGEFRSRGGVPVREHHRVQKRGGWKQRMQDTCMITVHV